MGSLFCFINGPWVWSTQCRSYYNASNSARLCVVYVKRSLAAILITSSGASVRLHSTCTPVPRASLCCRAVRSIVRSQFSLLLSHRTEENYQNSLVIKRVIFEAFDCYLALFYIAFYRLDVVALRAELIGLFSGKGSIFALLYVWVVCHVLWELLCFLWKFTDITPHLLCVFI